MRRSLIESIALAALVLVPSAASAGWVVEWTNVAVKQDGERMAPQTGQMSIAGGRVRMAQPEVITLIDYNTGSFTLLNPTKEYFWTGTVDQYIAEMTEKRAAAMEEKFSRGKGNQAKKKAEEEKVKRSGLPEKIDPAKLPPLSIMKTNETAKIAGFDTVKYEIRTNGELFQEVWVAPIDLSADLDIDRYLAQQRKMTAAMMGKSAGPYNALYLSDEYRKLLEKTFVLKLVTHHIAGGYERVATSMQQAEVPASQFEVPESYRRVRLSDVMNPVPAAAGASAGKGS